VRITMALELAQLKVEPDRAPSGPSPVAPRERRARFQLPSFERSKVGIDDLVIFTRQLALLLHTGNGLVPSIEALATQFRSERLQVELTSVGNRLKEGSSLSDAMNHHPATFDRMFVSLVQAGEASGQLRESLERLASVLDTRRRLRVAVREAMTYPVILMIITAVVLVALFTFILPRFATIFAGFGAELPWVTRTLLEVSQLLASRWWIVVPILLLITISGRRLWESGLLTRVRDDLKLRAPFVRAFYADAYMFQLFVSLGLLISSRVPLLEAIAITRGTVRNRHYDRFFTLLADHVEQGRGLAPAFRDASFLPDAVKLMIVTGESSGALDVVMVRLSERYRENLESGIRRLASAIEPIMLVLVGLVVGIVAISLILPLFKLSRALH